MDYTEIRRHVIAAVIAGDIDVSYVTLDEINMIKEEFKAFAFHKEHTSLYEERKVMVFADDDNVH